MNLSILFTLIVAAFFSYAAPASAEPVLIEGQKNMLPWFKCNEPAPVMEILSLIEAEGAQASVGAWQAAVIVGTCASPTADHEMLLVEVVKSVKNKHSDRIYSVVRVQDVAGRDFWAITGNAIKPVAK